jgi:hypothetical protein
MNIRLLIFEIRGSKERQAIWHGAAHIYYRDQSDFVSYEAEFQGQGWSGVTGSGVTRGTDSRSVGFVYSGFQWVRVVEIGIICLIEQRVW